MTTERKTNRRGGGGLSASGFSNLRLFGRGIVALCRCCCLLIGVGIVISASGSSVVSSLPSVYDPGVPFYMTNTVVTDPDVLVYAVEDVLPLGWSAAAISDYGSFDAANQSVKWGPFFDGLPRTLIYQAVPPPSASGTVSFVGSADFNVLDQVAIGGQRTTTSRTTSAAAIFCTMPAAFYPGVAFTVTNIVTLDSKTAAYAVQDQLPAGWGATSVSDNGTFDPTTQIVKWGPFVDGLPRTLKYLASPPAGATNALFVGEGNFDGRQISIGGQRQVAVVQTIGGTAISAVPDQYRPGQWFSVTNVITPTAGVSTFAVEDQPPAGWLVTNINHGGAFNSVDGKVQWGLFYSSGAVTLTYDVQPPAGASSTALFSGTAILDSVSVPISGQRQSTPVPVFYGAVLRVVASNYAAGVAFAVTNLTTVGSNITSYAVEDLPPSGWIVSNVSDHGTFDPATSSVKWGPFFDHQARALSYRVTPSAGSSGAFVFNGEANFDTTAIPISGQQETTSRTVFNGSVVSVLPTNFTAGGVLIMTDSATPPVGTLGYAVDDAIPSGWTATDISDGGEFDSISSSVKWGPFFDDIARVLTCHLHPPLNPSALAQFQGVASFDGNVVGVTGQRSSSLAAGLPVQGVLTLANPQWASGSGLRFDFTNASGLAVVVAACDDPTLPLAQWTVLGAPTSIGNNVYRFYDATSTNHPQRFYRLRSP